MQLGVCVCAGGGWVRGMCVLMGFTGGIVA